MCLCPRCRGAWKLNSEMYLGRQNSEGISPDGKLSKGWMMYSHKYASTPSTMWGTWGLVRGAGSALRGAHCLVGGQTDTYVTLQVNGGAYKGMDQAPIHCTIIPGSSDLVGERESEFVAFFPLVMRNSGKGRASQPGVKSQLSH